MNRDFVLAFDVGTGGIKAVVTDLDGNLRSVAASPLRLYGAEQGFAEHDPEDLWKCLCACSIKALIECGLPSSGLRGVVSATYWKGILPVSADGKPLCRMIL